MAYTPCKVQVTLHDIDGAPSENAVVLAELSETVVHEGIVIPGRVLSRANDQGIAVLDLFPNDLAADKETHYYVYIVSYGAAVQRYVIRVPNVAEANFRDLIVDDVPFKPGQVPEVAGAGITENQVLKLIEELT